jgi:monofunctional biosynthetic peptidoglycan transglycosylase
LADWYAAEPRGIVTKPQRQVLTALFTSMLMLSASFKYRPVPGVVNYLYWTVAIGTNNFLTLKTNCQPVLVSICQRVTSMRASGIFIGALLMTVLAQPLSSELDWFVVNDNVMGGRSQGDFKIDQGELFFGGSTNTRGGGFSSIRTAPLQLDLSNYDGVRLKVLGDGRRYTWRLTTEARWRGRRVSYWADFDTVDGEWRTVDIPFPAFIPQFRGVRLEGPGVDPAQITGMGLMINDKQDGPFELRLASVHAYAAQQPFAIEQYRWQQRALIVNAADGSDRMLVRLQSELAAAPEQFADRDMQLVLLLDDGSAVAGQRPLTQTEVDRIRAELGFDSSTPGLRLIGKDGSVKLATESAALDDIYSLIDTMPMRRSEMAER